MKGIHHEGRHVRRPQVTGRHGARLQQRVQHAGQNLERGKETHRIHAEVDGISHAYSVLLRFQSSRTEAEKGKVVFVYKNNFRHYNLQCIQLWVFGH